jgi:hypothetical protein
MNPLAELRGYYAINRDVWPQMSRRACALSAWRLWRWTKPDPKERAAQ